MNLKFRQATTDDVSLIGRLANSIWRKHYVDIIPPEQMDYMLNLMYSPDSLLKQISDGHKFTLVHNDETPIGYISLSTKDNKNYFLHKLYVEVDEQGKGIGSSLFTYILKEIPDAETIELSVNRQNYKAVNFYFKNGFVIKEVRDFGIGNGYFMYDFVMIKKIK